MHAVSIASNCATLTLTLTPTLTLTLALTLTLPRYRLDRLELRSLLRAPRDLVRGSVRVRVRAG